MSPPLPVPSKAAIHALRGLALGTSCAIGLIVEDRRRRISTLRTAINNKKKLRSSRTYHGAAEAAAHAVDDPVILSRDELHWHYRHDRPGASQDRLATNASATRRARDDQDGSNNSTALVSTVEHSAEQRQPPHPIETLLYSRENPSPQMPSLRSIVELPMGRDSGGWVRSPVLQSKTKPGRKIAELVTLSTSSINELIAKDQAAFSIYLADLIADCETKTSFSKPDDGWFYVSAIFCKHCQSQGKWPEAQRILTAVVRMGPLDEDRFYAYDPIQILESILPTPETDRRDLMEARLQLAIKLFLAKFKEKPRSHAGEVLDFGKTLIGRLLHFNRPRLVHQVYWRVLGQLEQPEAFTAWFIQTMFDYHDHKSVVKYFRLNFSKMSPDLSCLNTVVDLVLQSVEAMRGAQVDPALHALAKLCKDTGLRPKAGWLIRLVEVHWSRYKDLGKSKEFFDEMLSTGLVANLTEPEQLYQIMVKLSVLADDLPAAQQFYQKTITLAPHMAKDIWLNGYMTLAKAKRGLWDEVLEDFSEMKPRRNNQGRAYDQTFTAVLKVYIQDHPISDVEKFIKLYTNEMGVRLHRYMVTLVANKYGQLHDAEGFMQWLGYCNSAGFALDPAFCNAILRNCRLKWKFPFQQLRKLFATMQKLEPTCVDAVTERIMHNAAMEDGYYTGKNIRQRVRLLGVSLSKLPYHSKSANERDVLHAMTEELVRGRPVKAMVIYRRALRFGMPWCPRCFRVAVTASLKQNGDNFDKTIKLIGDAHQNGHDVTSTVAIFLKAQITKFRGSFDEVMLNLKTLVIHFETLGMLVDSSVLTHVAIVCAQFGQFDKAINLCKLAMEQNGTDNPCFSRQSLRALLMAYWQKLDVSGMRWLMESLLSSPLASDKRAFELLISTRTHMKKWKHSHRVLEITQILQEGMEEIKQQRWAQIDAGAKIYNETLRIMGNAAAELQHEDRDEVDPRKLNLRTGRSQKSESPQMQLPASVKGF
jgi:tetratricopeptide (TPR) repeat protein